VELTSRAALRLALIGVLGVLLQLTAVSQVSIFGVQPDFTPLLVASIGFLCGSVPGACFGFGVGLFMDTATLQTLGVESLIFTVVGYGAGRVRELRDPAHGLAPIAVGAAGTAVATIGFAVLQFLLGVDAPVSFQLLREILMTVLLNTLLALPIYALCRRIMLPYLPDDPRRRRRRAYTTGGLSPLSRV
jgi:rod shape-determining protein MreD